MEQGEHPAEAELRVLMMAGLNGDAAAHRMLLEKLSGHLCGYFKSRFARIGHGPTEAEDLMQETLIAIHTRRNTYDSSQPLTPWVYAIARYKFLDYPRRTKVSFKDVPIEAAGEFTAHSFGRRRCTAPSWVRATSKRRWDFQIPRLNNSRRKAYSLPIRCSLSQREGRYEDYGVRYRCRRASTDWLLSLLPIPR
jgi:DNA-directed RNA polymerase specialized sigma24 family protein